MKGLLNEDINPPERHGMLRSGMEEGVNDSCDRLDELLEKMQK